MSTTIPIQPAVTALLFFASVASGLSAQSIDANERMALSLTNGQVYSWGASLDGGGVDPLTPTPLTLPSVPTALSAGASFSLFLMPNGEVWGGGENGSGQLGRGVLGGPLAIGQATAVPEAIGVEAGFDRAYAWTANGSLFGWGNTNFLGLGTGAGNALTPQVVPIPANIVEVALSGHNFPPGLFGRGEFTLARDDQGNVWGWGRVPSATANTMVPIPIPNLGSITSIKATYDQGLALDASGVVTLISSTALLSPGEAFLPGVTPEPALTPILNLPPIQSITASHGVLACLDFNGDVWAIQSSFPVDGFLGNSLSTAQGIANPVLIPRLQNIIEIASNRSLYARDNAGTLWVMGPRNCVDGLGLGARGSGVFRPARVSMNGPQPSVAVSIPGLTWTRTLPFNLTCPSNGFSRLPLSMPAIGGEIVIESFTNGPPLLFVAPGPATPPQILSNACSLFLDLPALTSFLNAGIGPFAPQITNSFIAQYISIWVFQIPDLPGLAGFTLSAQSAWARAGTQLPFEVGAGYTLVIN